MKKKLGLISLIILVAAISASVASATTKYNLIVNGQVANVDPVMVDGRLYVPLRAAAEMLGADVNWDGTTNTATITSKGAPAVKTGSGIGDMQMIGGLAITLNSVEYVTEARLSPDNDQYVVLDVTIQNTNDKAISVAMMYEMELQDADGYKHGPTLYIDGKGSLTGDIPAGDSIRGQVAFDVDKSSEYKFIYTPVFGNGQVSWSFKQ